MKKLKKYEYNLQKNCNIKVPDLILNLKEENRNTIKINLNNYCCSIADCLLENSKLIT